MQSYKERFEACQDGEVAKNLELLKRLSYSLSQATRWGAIGAAITAGFGDKYESDNLAVNAIREYLNGLDIDGTIVIGEGERDEAPMLYIGERVGTGKGEPLHIAVAPLENPNATAIFAPRAISVLAASEPGGLFHAPDMYMDKLIVGVEAKDKVDLDAPTEVNL